MKSTFLTTLKSALCLARLSVLAVGLLIGGIAKAAPQSTEFTYQGRLQQNGTAANGNFNLSFSLHDDASAGSQVGSTIAEPGFPVTDGLFTVSLDFGNVFTGTQLWLQVAVNGTPLSPRQAVTTAPVSQFSLSGSIGGPAGGALTGSYPNPVLAGSSVGTANLVTSSVTNSKLASSAVTSSKIATGAVTSDELGSSSVTTDKIANDSVTRAKLVGGSTAGNISLTIPANTCADVNITVGGAQTGDIPFFSLQAGSSLPQKVLITPLKVSAASTVLTRVCNFAATSQSVTDMPIYLITLR